MGGRRVKFGATLSLALALHLLAPLDFQLPALAHSQTYDQTIFSYSSHPDLPLRLYAAGRLGDVSPSYARSYLIAAYRYLSGKPLSPAEQVEYLALWHTRLHLPLSMQSPAALNQWLSYRARLLAVKEKQPPYDEVVRCSKSINEYCYLNCQDEAFNTARSTLNKRIAKYGAGSSYVKEWLKGQDAVFCHCAGPAFSYKDDKLAPEPAFPPALPGSAPLELRQDRDYQIAAAHFYAQEFDKSLSLFSKIGEDKSSVWQTTARYMMVRTLIRQSSLGKADGYAPEPLVKAIKLIKELQSDPRFVAVKSSLANLLDYAQLRLDPCGTVDKLGRALSQPGSPSGLRTKIDDYTVLLNIYFCESDDIDRNNLVVADKKAAAVMRQCDMTDWIWTFASRDKKDKGRALDRFKATHSLPWAVALASHITVNEPICDEIMAVLAKVPKKDPSFIVASYYRAGLLYNAGKYKESLALVREVEAVGQLPPSAANDFNDIKLKLVANFEQFMGCSFRTPAVVVRAWDYSELPEDMDKVEAGSRYPKTALVLAPASSVAFNKQMPMRYLLLACNSKNLPAHYRLDFAQALFVRAVMLSDYATASRVITMLKVACPGMTNDLTFFSHASTSAEREFAAACLIIKYPGMRPTVTGGTRRAVEFNSIDEWRDNWWSADSFNRSEFSGEPVTDDTLLPLSFLSAADKSEAKKEMLILAGRSEALPYLGNVILSYAKSHSHDARVPEALARLVKATKFKADEDSAISAVSERAFTLLHTRYKGNSWTRKTPFHY